MKAINSFALILLALAIFIGVNSVFTVSARDLSI
jgi:hypothetical protein